MLDLAKAFFNPVTVSQFVISANTVSVSHFSCMVKALFVLVWIFVAFRNLNHLRQEYCPFVRSTQGGLMVSYAKFPL